jgi:chemotaxis protein CheD
MEIGDVNPRPLRPEESASRFEGPAPDERRRVYLLPGELHVSAEPCRITTILGSCVSICLFDRTRLVGGMNHFLLPMSREWEASSLRFADTATVALIEKVLALGCRLENLTARVFGGSALFRSEEHYADSLGARNVEAAFGLLEGAGIPLVAKETGGNLGRKILFDTDAGVVWSKRV